MGMKPRGCRICGEQGVFNFCKGSGWLTGQNLKKAILAADMELDSFGDDLTMVRIPCPLKEQFGK